MGKQWQCGSGLVAVVLGLAMPVTAQEARRSLTQQSHVLFLQGERSSDGPYFMPGQGEQFRLVEE